MPHINSCRFLAFSASLRLLSLLMARILLRSGLSGSAIVRQCRLISRCRPQLLQIAVRVDEGRVFKMVDQTLDARP